MGGLAALAAARPGGHDRRRCIVVWQGGGLSHLDTFDMKPDAPREVRGEFRPIPTSVPGIVVCEHLPLVARLAHKLTIVRSMQANETNHERASQALVSLLPAERMEIAAEGPVEACVQARRAVERGARLVIARAGFRPYDTHTGGFSRLRDEVLPGFDRAFSTLVRDLDERGILATTLVVATGEFGRTPRINRQGGRDHHGRAWSAVLAGAGLAGGRVLGATDSTGTEVVELPVTPADLARTIYELVSGAAAEPWRARGRVISELFVS